MRPQCQMDQEALSRFLDEELPAEQRQAVESHLSGCGPCREWIQANQRLGGALAGLPRAEVPNDLWLAIESRLGGTLGPRWWRRPVALAAAAGLVLCLAGWLLVGKAGQTGPSGGTVEVNLAVLIDALPEGLHSAEEAFARHYGGRPIDRRQALAWDGLHLRPQQELPGQLKLVSLRKLQMKDQEGLLLRYSGGGEGVLVMQCPVTSQMQHGGIPSQGYRVGDCQCQLATAGQWNVIHLASDRACYCLVSTMAPEKLAPCLEALGIHQKH